MSIQTRTIAKKGIQNRFVGLLFVLFLAVGAALVAHAWTNDSGGLPAGAGKRNLVDPATGLLVLNQPDKPDWKEPDKTLPEVNYDGLPITEVAKDLKDKFKNEFDVLLPRLAPTQVAGSWDWQTTVISLRLMNVRASEVFNAMNLVFETSRTPLHWELMMNGHRPTALLRILPELIPSLLGGMIDPATGLPVAAGPERKSVVYFVGDLLGDRKAGKTIQDLVETVKEVYHEGTGADPNDITYHEQAQLLIVHSFQDNIGFLNSILSALKQKAAFDSQRRSALERSNETSSKQQPEPKAKPKETKAE